MAANDKYTSFLRGGAAEQSAPIFTTGLIARRGDGQEYGLLESVR